MHFKLSQKPEPIWNRVVVTDKSVCRNGSSFPSTPKCAAVPLGGTRPRRSFKLNVERKLKLTIMGVDVVVQESELNKGQQTAHKLHRWFVLPRAACI